MGLFNGGGRNRKKGCVSSTIKIDSFTYKIHLQDMARTGKQKYNGYVKWNNGNNICFVLFADRLIISYTITKADTKENINDAYYFEFVENNYGGDRVYFVCPYCQKRARFLYLKTKHFGCRDCAGLNYRSQQATKGHDLAAHKLIKFIYTKFKVTDDLTPMIAADYRPERPKGMHVKTYIKLKAELIELQREYNRQYNISAERIIKQAGVLLE